MSDDNAQILEYLHINKFRDIEDLKFDFGKKLTLIAGPNGTSKTSILGLIAQVFTFSGSKTKKHLNYDTPHKRISGTPYETSFSQIHKFTSYDEKSHLEYFLKITNLDSPVPAKLFDRKGEKEKKDNKGRIVVGKSRRRGEGNYILPVIYLGLKRLCPIGEIEEESKIEHPDSLKEFTDRYNKYFKEIFVTTSKPFTLESVQNKYKNFIGGCNGVFDSNGFSAGQDTISQIIESIMSFENLQKQLKDKYIGGILLIDEIEATLHPLALERLMKLLLRVSKDLNIQIIATTHSLETLQLSQKKEFKDASKIVYLTKRYGKLEYLSDANIQDIEEDMTAIKRKPSKPYIFALCEDDVALNFLNILLPENFKNIVKPVESNKYHGESELRTISNSYISKCNNFIVVLDGDQYNKITRKNCNKTITLCLPGKKVYEEIIFNILSNLPEDDVFFTKNKITKLMCMRDYPTGFLKANKGDFIKKLRENTKLSNIDKLVLKLWMNDNKNNKEIIDFKKQFTNKILKLKSKNIYGQIK